MDFNIEKVVGAHMFTGELDELHVQVRIAERRLDPRPGDLHTFRFSIPQARQLYERLTMLLRPD